TSCGAAGGACTQVITNVKPGVQEPSVPTGTLPALVTALPNLGSTPIAGGPAAITATGTVLKSNFTIRIQENYPDFFKSAAQFNSGAVFPNATNSSLQVNVTFSDIPPGLEISGCAAVLTDINGGATALPGGTSLSTSGQTAVSNTLTTVFTSA